MELNLCGISQQTKNIWIKKAHAVLIQLRKKHLNYLNLILILIMKTNFTQCLWQIKIYLKSLTSKQEIN